MTTLAKIGRRDNAGKGEHMKAIVFIAAALLAAPVGAQNKKNTSAQGQLNQANQSGRTFDGSRDGRGGSTLDGKDAVVKPDRPAARPSSSSSRSTPSSSSSSRPSSSSSSSSR